MTPAETVKTRLLTLGFASIVDLERTYAGRQQLSSWAPSWSATGRFSKDGFPYDIRGMNTMSVLASVPLNRWSCVKSSRSPIRIEIFAVTEDQPPPYWLKAWPE